MGTSFLKKTKIPNSEKKKKKGTIALENCFHSNPGRYVERPPPTLKIRGECYTCTTTSPPPTHSFELRVYFNIKDIDWLRKEEEEKIFVSSLLMLFIDALPTFLVGDIRRWFLV